MASQTAISVERKAKALRDFLFGVPAVLGRLNADGTLNPNITDGLSGAYVWIRLQDNRAAIPAININVTNKIAGAGVLARLRPDSGWEVMQLDPNTASTQFGTAAGSANQPDRVQEWDTTGVEAYRLVPGRITASSEGGLFVWIEPFIFNRKRWGGLHFLLTAPVSSGDRAFAVITFNPAAEDNDDAFSQVWSEDVPANFVVSDIPTYQDAQDYINATPVADGLIVLGGVLLGYGDTAVSVSQIVDVREWINPPLTGAGDVDAADVTYTEAETGDWTDSPGTAAAALDELASRLTGIEDDPGGGVGAFTELSDAPSSYTGQEGKIVAVNDGATGLEFIDSPVSGGSIDIYAPVSLSRQTPVGSSVTFSIPSGYDRFEIVILGASDAAAAYVGVNVTCNADTTNGNYRVQYHDTENATQFVGVTTGRGTGYVPAGSLTGDPFGRLTLRLQDAAENSSRYTAFDTESGHGHNTYYLGFARRKIVWQSAAALTSVTLTLSAGNFVAGSVAVLVGYKTHTVNGIAMTGVWDSTTLTWKLGTTSVPLHSTDSWAKYTQIGKTVSLQAGLKANDSVASGTHTLTGLPKPIVVNTGVQPVLGVAILRDEGNTYYNLNVIATDSSTLQLFKGAYPAEMTNAMGSGDTLTLSVMYETG